MQALTPLLVVALLATGAATAQAEDGSLRAQQANAKFRAEQQRLHGAVTTPEAGRSERQLRQD